jgi:elongation factor Ts
VFNFLFHKNQVQLKFKNTMSITATEVNKLRTMTGAGMMDCKKALTESNGDFEAAIDILRKKGQKVSAARADNATSEGIVLTNISKDGKNGKLLAFACETEPVSKTDLFRDLGKSIFKAAVDKNATSVEEIQKLALADGRSVQEHIVDLTGKIGEKIIIANYVSVSSEKVIDYVHSNGKLAVLVALKNVGSADISEVGKDVAMQIAAMKPVAVDKDDVDAKTVEREIEIGKDVNQMQCLKKLLKVS